MRLSDLRDLRVRTVDGDSLGRVHEVHCEDGRIIALVCGFGSFIERLTATSRGRRIPWESVCRIDARQVIVVADPPRRTAKPAASRTRRGTRRPSAPKSKR